MKQKPEGRKIQTMQYIHITHGSYILLSQCNDLANTEPFKFVYLSSPTALMSEKSISLVTSASQNGFYLEDKNLTCCLSLKYIEEFQNSFKERCFTERKSVLKFLHQLGQCKGGSASPHVKMPSQNISILPHTLLPLKKRPSFHLDITMISWRCFLYLKTLFKKRGYL